MEALAKQLARKLGVEVVERPRAFDYVLGAEPADLADTSTQFIDVETIRLASDERLLTATNLLATFGCVDLLRRPDGSWVVLEVGTDGLFSHVDRDLNDATFEHELLERVCASFERRFRSLHRNLR